MEDLLLVKTDKISLRLSKSWQVNNTSYIEDNGELAHMELRPLRKDLKFVEIWRDVPGEVAKFPDFMGGPKLFEEKVYKLFLQSNGNEKVKITHRDPVLLKDMDEVNGGKTVYGSINFKSQVGLSEFIVWVDAKPEFIFVVEVFPSKLDYRSDYEKILADVQDILTGLAMEYLRSTYQWGNISGNKPGQLEWLLLLRNIIDELDKAIRYIAKRPIRSLQRENVVQRAEKIKKIDSSVRSAVRCGYGKGDFITLRNNIQLKQQLTECRTRSTLDTMEHRWLANQLKAILRQLSSLYSKEFEIWNKDARHQTDRRKQALNEIKSLEYRIANLTKLEPIMEAKGEVPYGFVSLQLLGAPGYREAYKSCLVLSLGLRIEGGPLKLSVKDLNLLYEYWCYLALLRIIAEETGQEIAPDKIFSIQQYGLQVLLQKGREQKAVFEANEGRKISVTYNPRFQGEDVLIPQQPDMLISLLDENWPKIHLVLDAKYRVDNSPEYKKRYYSAGPPEDAINIMHRYRDAIIEKQISEEGPVHYRTVIQAAAVFPQQYDKNDSFNNSKLWQALDRIGVGAIPFLPDNTLYVQEWLRGVLNQGGFSTSQRAIAYNIHDRAQNWKEKAAQPVLVATLRGNNPSEHWAWIKETGLYYMPYYKTQRRQPVTRDIVFYLQQPLCSPGAVAYQAKISDYDIIRRSKIDTPWTARRSSDEHEILYYIKDIKKLPHLINNTKGSSFTLHRWTTILGLERAKNIEELSLETEPEWRLYEDLKAMEIGFRLSPGKAKYIDKDDPEGRTEFVLQNECRLRYAGKAGFIIKTGNTETNMSHPSVIEYLNKLSKD